MSPRDRLRSVPPHAVRGVATAAALCVALAAPAAAQAALADLGGHLSLGYAKVFIDERDPQTNRRATQAPGGSFSVTSGLDHPLAGDFRIGADIGYHLLGSSNEARGSLFATVDYSVFEAALLAHWTPRGWGPVGRVSFGPVVVSARAELSTAGGGAAFSDLAVEEVAAGGALDVTFISTRPSPVRVGLQVGTRIASLSSQTWTLTTARLTFQY